LIAASRGIQSTADFNGHKILNGSLHFRNATLGLDAGVSLDIDGVFRGQTTDALFRYAQLAQASTTISPNGALLSGDLLINGNAIAASAGGSQAGQTNDSAWAIAQAISGAAVVGLTAVANATTITGSSTLPPAGGILSAGQITINGVSVGSGNFVSAINAVSGQTGVVATVVAGTAPIGFPADIPYTLTLSAADGRNINVTGTAAFGLNDQNAVGTLTVSGELAEGGKANLAISGNSPTTAGFSAGVIAAVDSGAPVPLILDEAAGFDLTPSLQTIDGATSTIQLMDRKLDILLTLRSKLGAMQNTLELRNEFLATANETNAAARSRIFDADYAIEMSALIRIKILQSSGLAMLAQANVDKRNLVSMLLGAY
jgi:flagellin